MGAKITVEDENGLTRLSLRSSNGNTASILIDPVIGSSMALSKLINIKLYDENSNTAILESRSSYLNMDGKFPSAVERGALHLLNDKGVNALVIRLIRNPTVTFCFIELPNGAWSTVHDIRTILEKMFEVRHTIYCGTKHLNNHNTISFQIAQYVASLCQK